MDDVAYSVVGTEIVICDKCCGYGIVDDRINAYESSDIICPKCKGRMVLEKETRITYRRID